LPGKGSPSTPNVSPENVTWMVPGLLGAVCVKPGSQLAFNVVPVPGWQFGF